MLRDLSISELLQRIGASGDAAAYKELFLRYYERLVAFAGHITHNSATAEEAVSDVFLRLWMARSGLERVGNARLYLYIAVRNAALNVREKERRHAHEPETGLLALAAGAASDPVQQQLARETGNRLQAIVNGLPAQCRLTLRLVKEEGLRYKEVAGLLGLSVKTVEAQVSIALRRISRQLQPAPSAAVH